MRASRFLPLLLALSARGGEKAPIRPDTTAVRAVIQDLGDPRHERRQSAAVSLRDWSGRFPRYLLQQMADAYLAASDVETSTRLEQLMEPLAHAHVIGIPPGFIGINMTWSELQGGGAAIEIQSVLAGFPGEAAGLQTGDLILSIDAKATGDFVELNGFIDYVSQLPPGTPVELLLQRGPLQFLQTLVLGSRPEQVARGGTRQALPPPHAYEEWLRELREKGPPRDPDFPIGHFPKDASVH